MTLSFPLCRVGGPLAARSAVCPIIKELIMKAVIFDIDGTLSIVGDRVQYLQQVPKNWDGFYAACDKDLPNMPIVELAKAILANADYNKYAFFIVTGRREALRRKTIVWLESLDLEWDELLMRPDGDFRHDIIVKPELLSSFDIDDAIVFEDRASMVKTWRSMGYTCCQVAEGNF